jgi:hypothetical protein
VARTRKQTTPPSRAAGRARQVPCCGGLAVDQLPATSAAPTAKPGADYRTWGRSARRSAIGAIAMAPGASSGCPSRSCPNRASVAGAKKSAAAREQRRRTARKVVTRV